MSRPARPGRSRAPGRARRSIVVGAGTNLADVIAPEALVRGNPNGLFGVLWGTGGLWVLGGTALGVNDAGTAAVPVAIGLMGLVVGSVLLANRRSAMPTWAGACLTLVGSVLITAMVVTGGPVGGTAAGIFYVYVTSFARTATPREANAVVVTSATMHLVALLLVGREAAVGIWLMTWGVATIVGMLAGTVVDRLAGSAERLRQADQAKDRLLAIVSHELRTPLTAVIGATDTLLSDQAGRLTDGQRAELLAMARRQAHRQLGLVEDLLTLSLEADRTVDATRTTTDVPEAIVRATAALPVDVDLELDATALTAVCDPDHLERIVTNLVTNADRYGEPPLRVRSRTTSDDTVTIEVVDHGDGIEGGLSSGVFEPFETGHANGVASGSIGLGLAICWQLAVANGGQLTYDTTEGGGATVGVRLAAAASATERSRRDRTTPADDAPATRSSSASA